MRFYDNAVAGFGSGDDLKIYHDGSSNVLETVVNTKIGKSGEASAWFNPDGAVQLYYDNNKNLVDDLKKNHGAYLHETGLQNLVNNNNDLIFKDF